MDIINSNPYSYWQWDVGQVFTIPKEYRTFKFLIQNEGSTKSYVSVATTKDQENYEVPIPNIVLQTAGRILVYYCNGDIVFETENIEGETITTIQNLMTVAEQVLWVNKRGKPENYIYTPEDLVTYDGLSYQINKLKDRCQGIENDIENNSRSIENLKEADISLNQRISNIEQHISQDYFFTDDSVAYKKIVPTDACTYAQLNSIGGMTYKSKNLVNIPNIEANTTSIQGKTISVYLVDTIFVSAETLATVSSNIWRLKFDYKDGTSNYITDSAFESGGMQIKASASNPIVSITYRDAYITDGKYSGFMVSYSTMRVPYEPYYEGLRDNKVTALKVIGKNLFDMDNNPLEMGTYEDANFVLSNQLPKYQSLKIYLAAGTYTLSFGVDVTLIRAVIDGTQYHSYSNKTFTTKTDGYVGFSFRRTDSLNWVDGTLIQIERGETASEYTPYSERIITLPEALQGTGKGISDKYYDYVDFEKGKYIRYCKEIVLNGEAPNSEYLYQNTRGVSISKLLEELCNRQEGICTDTTQVGNYFNSNSIWVGVGDNELSSKTIYWIGILDILGFATADEFKEYAKQRYQDGNPIKIVYKLDTPIETDLPESFENILEVEGGGSLEFINEYKNAVPSSITYLKKEGSI